MKSLFVAAAVAAVAVSAVFSSKAFAADSAGKFEGVSFYGATGYQKTSSDFGEVFVVGTNADTGVAMRSASNNKIPAIIGLSYGFKLADKFVTTIGTDYNFVSSTLTTTTTTNTLVGNLKINNRYNLYVAPGFEITPSDLVYVKLAYTRMRTSLSAATTAGVALSATGGPSNNGLLYGVGYKRVFSDNLYGFTEYSYTKHSSGVGTNLANNVYSNTGDITTNSFLVGVGYKF